MSNAKQPDKKMNEKQFLAQYDPGDFERPSVAVDVAVFTVMDGDLWVALYEREEHPHLGRFALPGGFVGIDEGLDQAARRLLRDKAGLKGVYFKQLQAFGAPNRDPRMRIITIAHYALISPKKFRSLKATAAKTKTNGKIRVFSKDDKELRLAFDHKDVLKAAVDRLREILDAGAAPYQMLAKEFTLRQLQDVHEAIRGEKLNKDSFRRRLLASGELEATGIKEENTAFRPAELYRFKEAKNGNDL